MIYPDIFERKIGFTDIRTLLKGRCMSSLGTEWIDKQVHFMSDYNEINSALSEIQEFTQFLTEEDVYVDNDFLDVREVLLRARPERTFLEELDLFNLKRALNTVKTYVEAFTKTTEEDSRHTLENEEEHTIPYKFPALGRMCEDVTAFPQIIRRIDEILNKYGKVKDTASPELLSIRRKVELTIRSISHSLRSIINEAHDMGYIDRDVTPTLRDGRLVIPVAPALKRKIKGIVHDESATGKTVFIEPAAVVDANNAIRELKAAERREIIRILQELTAFIRPYIGEIINSQYFLAHIDYLRALNLISEKFCAIIPEVTNTTQIDWVQARHPLLQISLEKYGKKVIPLDVTLKQDQKILLISGPNAGGKSVCLKTAGLLQYMLQCGMPIPVGEASKPGIFSSIFIDIGDEQSIENDLSTYSSHLLNMKEMMHHGDHKSLLLIDEFGGGTEPQIGGALAEAILNRFVQNKVYGIITTHYQNLKHFAKEHKSIVNGAMLYDRTHMCPLFMLQVGRPGSSFAIEIARKTGIPEDVIKYAADKVGSEYIMSDKYLQDIVRDKLYWENKRHNIRQREKKLEELESRYEKDIADFRMERKVVLEKAKNEARHLLEQSNAQIENTIRGIKEAQAEKEKTREIRKELAEFKQQLDQKGEEDDYIARKIAQIQRRQQRKVDKQKSGKDAKNTAAVSISNNSITTNLGNRDNESIEDKRLFTIGDFVTMKGQTTIGKIESISSNSAKVLFGMMFTNVPLKRLTHSAPPKQESNVNKAATFLSKETRDAMYEKKLHFKPEIDIRGMRADEALTTISYFIDDSIQLEQSRVRILHGTGSGALRELVRNYLQTVSGISRFHDEHVQFGGAGITVVEI